MKRYLNIKEASKIVGLKEHVIRYWDSVDPKTNKLRIEGISTKSRAGTRYFNKDNLKKLQNLKQIIYDNGNYNPSLKLAEKIISKNIINNNNNNIKTLSYGNSGTKSNQNINQILEKMRNLLK